MEYHVCFAECLRPSERYESGIARARADDIDYSSRGRDVVHWALFDDLICAKRTQLVCEGNTERFILVYGAFELSVQQGSAAGVAHASVQYD